MVINHNISALNTYNQLSKNESATSSSLQKLSSGLRINSAADDAAGLAISQKMTAQVNGLDQANSNAQNGVSLVQTAEGALNETQSILQRMRELAVQSSNDTNQSEDRGDIQAEVNQLAQEITDISNDTEFNSQKLLNGSISSTGLNFQVGANEGQTLNVKINAMDAETLHVSDGTGSAASSGNNWKATTTAGINVSDQSDASSAISTIDTAISTVSTQRANLGAYQNRLEHTMNNLTTESQNLTSASSAITDVDMAKEMMNYSKYNILNQAAEAMLSQANQLPSGILSLLK